MAMSPAAMTALGSDAASIAPENAGEDQGLSSVQLPSQHCMGEHSSMVGQWWSAQHEAQRPEQHM
jgi:hypothetical protein